MDMLASQKARRLGSREPKRASKHPSILASQGFHKGGGFTIVELLVSILLTFIIMGAIYSVYRVQTHSAKVQENRMEAQEYARSVLDMMVREIRNAAYNPRSASSTICSGNPLIPGPPGIITATATSIRFTYDFQGAGTPPDCNDADEDITYTLTGSNITRTARSSTGGSLTTESLTDGNATDLQFVYYPQQTGASAPPPYCYPLTSLPSGCFGDVAANLGNIQRVFISLTIQSKKPDTEFGGQLTVQMTSNADLRNRGLPS